MPPQTSRHTADDPAVQAGELIVRVGMFILAVAEPCAAALSRRAVFSLTPIGAVLLIIGGSLAPRRASGELLKPWLTPAALALIFFVFWSGLSLIWTPWLASGGERFLRLAGTLLIFGLAADLAPTRSKTSNLYLLPFGVGVAAAATVALAILSRAQLVADGVNFDDSTLARASVSVAMLAWPALAALAVRGRRLPAIALACLAAAAVIAVGSLPAIAAWAAGALAFALSAARPRPIGAALAVLFALAFLLAPLLALAGGFVVAHLHHPPAFLETFPGWEGLVRSQGIRLVTGHGLDTAARAAAAGAAPGSASRSLLFETWYELGVVGAVTAAFLAAAAFFAAARAPQPIAPFLLAAMTCGLTLAVTALATAQLWWVTLASLTALFFGTAISGRYRTERPRVALVNAEASRRQPVA